MITRKSFYVMTFVMLVVLAPRVAAQVPTEVPPAVPGAKPVTVEHVKVHGASLEGNFNGIYTRNGGRQLCI